MPQVTIALTDDLLKGAPRGQVFTDSEMRGLTARVGARTTSFNLRYVAPGSDKQASIVIGDFPTLSVAEARLLAKMRRASIERGEVPEEVKRRERRRADAPSPTRITLWQVWEKYKDEVLATSRKDGGAALERIILKDIGVMEKRAVEDITLDDANALVKSVKARSPSMAMHLRDGLASAWRYAQKLKFISRDLDNVFLDIERSGKRDKLAPQPKQERFRKEEWSAWLRWLPVSGMSVTVQRALMLQALTGARVGEFLQARREDFDFDADGTGWYRTFFKRAPRNIYLNKQATALVKSMLAEHEVPWLFPSTSKEGHVLTTAVVWQIVQVRATCPVRVRDPRTNKMVDWSSHTIRRSVKAGLTNELKVPHEVSESVLGHVITNGVGKSYDHAEDWHPQIAEAMNRWGDLIDAWSR